jgi:hypothetical protein
LDEATQEPIETLLGQVASALARIDAMPDEEDDGEFIRKIDSQIE